MFAFVWSSCGRKPEYLEETHLPNLVTTWPVHMRRISNASRSGDRRELSDNQGRVLVNVYKIGYILNSRFGFIHYLFKVMLMVCQTFLF